MHSEIIQNNFVEQLDEIFLFQLFDNIYYSYKSLFLRYQNMSELLKSALLIDKIPYFFYCSIFTFNSHPKLDYNNPNVIYLYSFQRYVYIDIKTINMMPQKTNQLKN